MQRSQTCGACTPDKHGNKRKECCEKFNHPLLYIGALVETEQISQPPSQWVRWECDLDWTWVVFVLDELWRQSSFSKTAEQEIKCKHHVVGLDQSFIAVWQSSQNSVWNCSAVARQARPFGKNKTEHCFRINVLIMTGMHFRAVCRRQLFWLRAVSATKKNNVKSLNLAKKNNPISPNLLCEFTIHLRYTKWYKRLFDEQYYQRQSTLQL